MPLSAADDPEEWARAFVGQQQHVRRILDASGNVPIGGQHDGASFVADDPGQCADTLAMLAAAGYHLPAGVVEELRAEHTAGA